MSRSVKLPDHVVKDAQRFGKLYSRSVPKQIEYWVRIAKIVEANPDLPFDFIKGALLGIDEMHAGEVQEFIFEFE